MRGVRLVFDQHDLAPEPYESKFEEASNNTVGRVLSCFERQMFRAVDVVLVANESYRRLVVSLGHIEYQQVFTVRNSPDGQIFYPREPTGRLKGWHRHLVAFAGTMEHQAGVDILLKAAHHIRITQQRTDILFVLMGSGDAWKELQQIHASYALGSGVRSAGFLNDQEMLAYLSTADVGAAPDLAGPLNSVSTMECMAMGLPVVSFDLEYSRLSASPHRRSAVLETQHRNLLAAYESILCN